MDADVVVVTAAAAGRVAADALATTVDAHAECAGRLIARSGASLTVESSDQDAEAPSAPLAAAATPGRGGEPAGDAAARRPTCSSPTPTPRRSGSTRAPTWT